MKQYVRGQKSGQMVYLHGSIARVVLAPPWCKW